MATLHIIKGYPRGQRVPVSLPVMVLGRSRECQFVIPQTSVSRQHARILCVEGSYFIEDMESRNGTRVNGATIAERTTLKDRDRIQICEFQASFHADEQVQAPPDAGFVGGFAGEMVGIDEDETSTTVRVRLDFKHDYLLHIQSNDKLRRLFALAQSLNGFLEVDQLLPRVAEKVLELFKQADRCFIMLKEETSQKLCFGAIKSRRHHSDSLRYSNTIVKRCLESVQGLLTDDAQREMPDSASVITCGIHSAMCVPLCGVDGVPFGVLQVDALDQSCKFVPGDLELLMGAACQVITALETAWRHETLIASEQKELGLELAGQVQRSILPTQLPQLPGYEFFAYYASALQVGGDYYDFISLPPHRLAITVADVAGKGLPAALLATKLCGDTRNYLLAEVDPTRAISRLNDLAVQYMDKTDRFVTLIAAVLDAESHTAALVNAGHLTPLLYRRATGTVEDATAYEAGGQPLGLDRDRIYPVGNVELQPGDSLILFTDGVTDALNLSAKRFGPEGILRALSSGGPFTATALGERVRKALDNHSAGSSQIDDITLVVFGRKT
jgi:serine phosphatase RsbU (regulator of sigma subunit)